MNVRKHLLLACGLILAVTSAWADRSYRHHHQRPRASVEFGLYFGAPWVYPSYYPYPYYGPRVYVPPVVAPVIVTPPQPPVYVEQPLAYPGVPTLEPGFWYYCDEAQAYYPYVKQCPGVWRKVAPQPPQ